jgi:hypothetical protein
VIDTPPQVTRERLAALIDAVLTGRETDEEWFECIVNHYHDEAMESARRFCAKVLIAADCKIEHVSAEDRARLLDLAAGLRKSEPNS